MNKQTVARPHNEELIKTKLEELDKKRIDKWMPDKGVCIHFLDELFKTGEAYTTIDLYGELEDRFDHIKNILGKEFGCILTDYKDVRLQLYRDAYSAALKSSIIQIKNIAARSGQFVTSETKGNDINTYYYKTKGFSIYLPEVDNDDDEGKIRREITKILDNFYAFGNKTRSAIARVQKIIAKSDSSGIELYKNISNELDSITAFIETSDTINELRNYSYIIEITQRLKNQTVQKSLIEQITIINQLLREKPKGWGTECEQRYNYTIDIAREIDDKVVFANFAVKFAEFAIFYKSLKPTAIKLYCEAIEIYKNHIDISRDIESMSYIMQMHNRLTYLHLKLKHDNEAIASAQDALTTITRIKILMGDSCYPIELNQALSLASAVGCMSTAAPRDSAIYGMKYLLDGREIPEDITLKALE